MLSKTKFKNIILTCLDYSRIVSVPKDSVKNVRMSLRPLRRISKESVTKMNNLELR